MNTFMAPCRMYTPTSMTSIINMSTDWGDPVGEQHTHWHEHDVLKYSHPHTPDMHHVHRY